MDLVYILYGIVFEWDIQKSHKNRLKHGLSFEQATEIWKKELVFVGNVARSLSGETRNAAIGFIEENLYVAIFTERGKRIRLISVRRARNGEKEVYKKKISNRPGNG